ncbi:hypothetical protein AJ80_09015 [Polytolypa hystricis UAMH7299]|uniref:Uncharacterized protein n=1 Tax=Polytolypa hystricis (strain UAMH7299) TaxID=1447883 RepID=A0A2B7WXC0_POLH7|nr:hypothetical protein AJ80_09015 [Polytolypa hystricis UAMH7299]
MNDAAGKATGASSASSATCKQEQVRYTGKLRAQIESWLPNPQGIFPTNLAMVGAPLGCGQYHPQWQVRPASSSVMDPSSVRHDDVENVTPVSGGD